METGLLLFSLILIKVADFISGGNKPLVDFCSLTSLSRRSHSVCKKMTENCLLNCRKRQLTLPVFHHAEWERTYPRYRPATYFYSRDPWQVWNRGGVSCHGDYNEDNTGIRPVWQIVKMAGEAEPELKCWTWSLMDLQTWLGRTSGSCTALTQILYSFTALFIRNPCVNVCCNLIMSPRRGWNFWDEKRDRDISVRKANEFVELQDPNWVCDLTFGTDVHRRTHKLIFCLFRNLLRKSSYYPGLFFIQGCRSVLHLVL